MKAFGFAAARVEKLASAGLQNGHQELCVEVNVLSGLGFTTGIEQLFNQRPVTTRQLIAGRMRNRLDGRQRIMKHLLTPVRTKLLKVPKIRKPKMRNKHEKIEKA